MSLYMIITKLFLHSSSILHLINILIVAVVVVELQLLLVMNLMVLEKILGEDISPNTLMNMMFRSQKIWDVVEHYITFILRTNG